MKGGSNHSGLVKSETATELVLDSPEDGKLTLKKADIDKRIRGLSAMPEGVDKLMTRRELRDLVEYLSGLKGRGQVRLNYEQGRSARPLLLLTRTPK